LECLRASVENSFGSYVTGDSNATLTGSSSKVSSSGIKRRSRIFEDFSISTPSQLL